jgi:Xaa-Pro aminopeptidase
LRARLPDLGVEALLVTCRPNVLYLSNHGGSAGIVLLTGIGIHLLVDARYSEAVRQRQASTAACPTLQVHTVPASYDQAVVERLRDLGLRTVGVEADDMSLAQHAALKRALGDEVEIRSTDGVIEAERCVKDAYEQERLRESAERLTEVAQAAFAAVRPGVTEREVAGAIEAAIRQAGYEQPAFETIVGSGPNGALPHHSAGSRRLELADLVVLDFGAVLDGYCSDLTRTVAVGEVSTRAEQVYAAVLEAQQAAIEAVRPGVAASAVDEAARRVLRNRGLDEAFSHSTGHGLGLEVHELPRIAQVRGRTIPDAILQSGMVFTVEPGAYLPGWGGVRIEDDVLVTDKGCEVLTSVTRELLTL